VKNGILYGDCLLPQHVILDYIEVLYFHHDLSRDLMHYIGLFQLIQYLEFQHGIHIFDLEIFFQLFYHCAAQTVQDGLVYLVLETFETVTVSLTIEPDIVDTEFE